MDVRGFICWTNDSLDFRGVRYLTGLPTAISPVMKQSAGPPSLHHDLLAVFKIVILWLAQEKCVVTQNADRGLAGRRMKIFIGTYWWPEVAALTESQDNPLANCRHGKRKVITKRKLTPFRKRVNTKMSNWRSEKSNTSTSLWTNLLIWH